MIFRLLVLLIIGALVILAFRFISQLQQINPKATNPYTVYYGAFIPNWYNYFSNITDFETRAQKPLAIVMWYQSWGTTGDTKNLQLNWMDQIRSHGSIPMITWEPWNWELGVNQPAFSLKNIINGQYDTYITKWAQDSKAWGNPYFLRFAHEMNASNYPWNENKNGNSPGEYVQAWKHVRDIFTAQEVNNVTWVWCPNVEYSGTIPLEGLYPGDSYVDWTCMDGWNGGTELDWGGWLTFPQIFTPTYNHLQRLAPSKPIMIAEFASVEGGGSKVDWITDAYSTQVPNNFPNIKALVWFNENREVDWRIESSATSQSSFATSIASPYYTSNQYASLVISPIPAPEAIATSSPTPTAIVAPIATPTPVPVDIIPPQVSITTPQSGSVIAKKTYISALASDNIKVTKVDFYIDNVQKTSDTSSPYEYYWKTNRVQSGAHIIKVIAYDAANNSSSAQITVIK